MKIDREQLVKEAVKAAGSAYAPYSSFSVGAAVLGASGRVFTGCNVENASYGLTVCAERVAVWKAVADGERQFVALAISVPGGGAPCGACRQVLHEFAPNLQVLMADANGIVVREAALAELLPEAFGPQSLEEGC